MSRGPEWECQEFETSSSASEGELSGFITVLRRIGPVALLSSMMQIFMILEIHIYVPYLYTRVRCCSREAAQLGVEFDIVEPPMVKAMLEEATAAGLELTLTEEGTIGACDIPHFPMASDLWSFSPSCVNKPYVQETAQHVMAAMKPLQTIFVFMVLPVGGALADRIGRIPVLAMYCGGLSVACLLSAMDTSMQGVWGDTVVYVAGCLFGLAFQPKDSVLSSAVADILGNDEVSKGRAFVSIASLNSMLAFWCNMAMYVYLRRHHESHLYAWVGSGTLALVIVAAALLLVREPLPAALRGSPTWEMLNPFFTQSEALRLLARDRVLILQACLIFVFYAYFLGFITVRTSYLTSVGFKMEEALLPEILSSITACAFSMVFVPVMPRLGIWHLSTLGNLLFTVGYAVIGPFTVLVSLSGAYLAGVICSCAAAVTFPAFQTIVSQRVGKEHQAKCQAAVSSVGALGAVLGIPLYNNVLFSARTRGLDRARCPMVSMGLAALCVVISMYVARLAARTAPPAEKQPPQAASQ